jgi:hypothetical protein
MSFPRLIHRIVSLSLVSTLALGAAAAPLERSGAAPASQAAPVADGGPSSSSPFFDTKVGAFASPAGLFLGVVAADLGVAVTPHVALALGGSYFDYGLVQGYGVDLGSQLFLKEAFRGLYGQPRVGFDQAQVTVPDILAGTVREDSVTLMHFDFLAGYQWLFDGGVSIRVGGGIRYSAGLGDVQGVDASEYQRLRPLLDGAVGYVF